MFIESIGAGLWCILLSFEAGVPFLVRDRTFGESSNCEHPRKSFH